MDYRLERTNCVGLFCKGARFFDACEIANQCRAGAGHGTHRRLGTLSVAPMQDDVMAQRHQALSGQPSKAVGRLHEAVRKVSAALTADRPLTTDIERMARGIRGGMFA